MPTNYVRSEQPMPLLFNTKKSADHLAMNLAEWDSYVGQQPAFTDGTTTDHSTLSFDPSNEQSIEQMFYFGLRTHIHYGATAFVLHANPNDTAGRFFAWLELNGRYEWAEGPPPVNQKEATAVIRRLGKQYGGERIGESRALPVALNNDRHELRPVSLGDYFFGFSWGTPLPRTLPSSIFFDMHNNDSVNENAG